MKKTNYSNLSEKGNELINFYKEMVQKGYLNDLFNTPGSSSILRNYREFIKENAFNREINSVLDYGAGKSDWTAKGFDNKSNQSAKEYFNIKEVNLFEPSVDIINKTVSDCVTCIDVLEHIFLGDLKNVLIDIYNHAKKIVVIHVACYLAVAKLPNGENAHITVRNPDWWKGFIDGVSSDFPQIETLLMCADLNRKMIAYKIWSAKLWHQSEKFKINN